MCNEYSGFFITLEGTDGSGKSTAAKILVDQLVELGLDVVWTREPGGSQFGETLRELLLEERPKPLHQEVDTLLLFAARIDHLETLIKPNLWAGHVVVCERFTDSTYAYQVSGGNLNPWLFQTLEDNLTSLIEPDLTLWLDVSQKVAFKRLKGREKGDKFETLLKEDPGYFQRLRKGYRLRHRISKGRMQHIHADKSIEQVTGVLKTYALTIAKKVKGNLEPKPIEPLKGFWKRWLDFAPRARATRI